ncbi:MAG TPA: hypothetical protein VJX73_16415 [Terracidiphilus sp.]|nr:hypothetical protein [Terracidiphilus sp.]
MSTELLHAPLHSSLMGPASRYVKESREAMLAYEIEELGALRFSIILTARWEASDDEDPQQRAELRADLSLLRRHFSDKIDEIAMTFGVEEAMKAKDTVERTVVVPRDLKPLNIQHHEEVPSEESDDPGYGL